MAGSRELSLSLIGLAGGLLVGNFAAFNGFLALADTFGDQTVTVLLAVSTVLLTTSIVFGGWGIGTAIDKDPGRWYNWQAIAGLFGLLAALAMPLSSLWFREPPDADQANQIAVLQQALTTADQERDAIAERNLQLSNALDALQELVTDLQSKIENPPPE